MKGLDLLMDLGKVSKTEHKEYLRKIIKKKQKHK